MLQARESRQCFNTLFSVFGLSLSPDWGTKLRKAGAWIRYEIVEMDNHIMVIVADALVTYLVSSLFRCASISST